MKRQVESSSPNMDMKRQVETSSPNMDIKKVLKSHEALLFQNKEDPNFVERTEKIPFAHTVGTWSENAIKYLFNKNCHRKRCDIYVEFN